MNTNTKKICPHCKSEIILSAKKCPECQSDLRNWFVRHWIISSLLFLMLLGFILQANEENINPNKPPLIEDIVKTEEVSKTTVIPQNSVKNKEVAVPVKEAPKNITKQYIEVFKFSGIGQKKSEPFTITGSRLKIAYECSGDQMATYCGGYIYKVGSKFPQLIMNAGQSVKDETIIYGSGEYYIEANTMGNFSMTVYDYR